MSSINKRSTRVVANFKKVLSLKCPENTGISRHCLMAKLVLVKHRQTSNQTLLRRAQTEFPRHRRFLLSRESFSRLRQILFWSLEYIRCYWVASDRRHRRRRRRRHRHRRRRRRRRRSIRKKFRSPTKKNSDVASNGDTSFSRKPFARKSSSSTSFTTNTGVNFMSQK